MKINLVGWPLVKAGMGEHMRKVATAFDAASLDYQVNDVLDQCFNNLSLFDNADFTLQDKKAETIGNDLSIFGLNLNHLPRIDKSFYDAKINIGYGYYEQSSLLDPFVQYQEYLDEVWAPSQFIQKVLSKKLTIPVVHMPIPLAVHGTRKSIRVKFGLPAKSFLYLTTFDMRSLIERKNPHAVIDAFKLAFKKIKADVGLVIKLTYSQSDEKQAKQLQALKEYCGNKNIYMITDMLPHNEVLDLINDCNCYISLHRAEGLGLGMAEAMCMGKPVIATGYSGNMEFMTPNNSCVVNYTLIEDYTYKKMIPNYETEEKFYWAEADVEDAAGYIRRIYLDDAYRTRIETEAKAYMQTNYSSEVIGKAYRDRINILLEKTKDN